MNKKVVGVLALLLALCLAGTSMAISLPAFKGKDDSVTITREEYERLIKFQKLDMILQIIDYYYYEDYELDDLLDGAAAGLVYGLGDIYSTYYNKEQMEKATEENTGRYAGIGCQLIGDPDDKLITITRVFKGSPAEKAGIIAGDKIVYVDDVYYTAYEMDDAVEVMRGTPGEIVKVTVLRGLETVDFDISRELININYVEYQILPDNIGYVMVYDFLGNAVEGFREALQAFQEAGVDGMIIDLRNNGGGFVNAAVEMADMILPQGVAVTLNENGNVTEWPMDDVYYKVPMAVLVNGFTASASEILSGAVRDYKAGTLIGTKTFGKGVVQSELEFQDGTGIKVTSGRYYTPSGECIHGVGIEPDIECDLPEEVVTRFGINNIPYDQDEQLQCAVRVLTGNATPGEAEKIVH